MFEDSSVMGYALTSSK